MTMQIVISGSWMDVDCEGSKINISGVWKGWDCSEEVTVSGITASGGGPGAGVVRINIPPEEGPGGGPGGWGATTEGTGGFGGPVCNCLTSSGIFFDDDATPDTIVAGGSITVVISGGCPPYSWTVSGTGYTLDYAETTSGTNVLNCAAGSCGVDYDVYPEVFVTDTCGSGVDFRVRNTSGHWQIYNNAGIGGCSTSYTTYRYTNATCRVKVWCGTGTTLGEPQPHNCQDGEGDRDLYKSFACPDTASWCAYQTEVWEC